MASSTRSRARATFTTGRLRCLSPTSSVRRRPKLLPSRDSVATGAQAIRLGDGEISVPPHARRCGKRSRARCRRACALRRISGMVRGEVYGAEYLGTTQVVTVTTRYGALKARAPASVSSATGRRWARFPARSRCRSSTRRRAGRSAPRCMREARMAEVEIRAVSKASRRRRPSSTCRWRPWGTANSSRCSGRRVPARRRHCA